MKPRKILIKQMRQNINNTRDKRLNEILELTFKAIKKYPENWTDNVENIRESFYTSFTETYAFTSKQIKQMYNPNHLSDFMVQDVKNLTYKEDGKTFDQRFDEHISKAAEMLKSTTPADYQLVFADLAYKFEKILITETAVIETAAKKNHRPKQEYGYMLIIDSGCDECPGGEFPADEDVPLPPFHPCCQCEYWYDLTDNTDDIEDLDLEIEVEE